ncbi:hypothetical protein C8E08_1769 [Paracidovorax citrulli]|nr:hypothetical protein C8E08_1769 [Paracidovorax citrulli]QCX10357.1 hypothetical protein APS58_1470 [Paracidovorax citrulli]REG71351.1 hypothetical protein C8E07_4599 [Paracidovorax citrulli]RLJ95904.1 hypothetical protein C8E06_4594 [Paracidovorax citrulli]SDL22999.1 hypothetical protein SAMN04489709_13616 [Paracidovorax citrulli]
MIEAVMATLLAAFALTTLMSWRGGNEHRDVGLLAALTGAWGAATAVAVAL